MIKTLIAVPLLLTASLMCHADDWGGVERYAADNSGLMASAYDASQVVLLGNSITENWAGDDPGFFGTNKLIGRGISGHTSYQFLVRFREDVINLKPLAVVINVGTNDIAENTCRYDENRTFDNLQTMVELARLHGIKVILTSVLPADRFCWRTEIGDVASKVKSLNSRIAAYAAQNGLPYVDYHSLMADPATGGMKAGLSSDGVHPTHAGYTIMEGALLPVITSIRNSKN